MHLEILAYPLSVCKLDDPQQADLSAPFYCLARTDKETSLVCRTQDVPAGVRMCEDGWCALRIAGTLDFSLIGILSALTAVLAQAQISVFAVSTYDTDYILVRSDALDRAVCALEDAGYSVRKVV